MHAERGHNTGLHSGAHSACLNSVEESHDRRARFAANPCREYLEGCRQPSDLSHALADFKGVDLFGRGKGEAFMKSD